MLEIEVITRSGPIILMSNTEQGLYMMFRRFISPSSLAIADEPDETYIPSHIHNQRLREPKLQKDIG